MCVCVTVCVRVWILQGVCQLVDFIFADTCSLQTLYIVLLYFIIRESINSNQNKATMDRLIKEVKGLNPSFNASDIRGK